MRRRFYLIVNPGAGVIGSPLVEETVRALELAGASVTRLSAGDFDATRRAAAAAAASGRYDAIVAAGGDGTIRQVAAAMLGSDTPLGIIPAGTANVLALEIGLARTASAVSRYLLEGPVINVACGRANGEPFLLMVGAGFDAHVLAGLDRRAKSVFGKAAFIGPLLGALVRPMDTLALAIDGRHYEASWAVIANARHYGGRFVLAPRAHLHEPGLEAILFKARSRARLLSQLLSLVMGRLESRAGLGGDVEMVLCSRVTVTSHCAVPTQIDGDVLATTPLEVEAGTTHVRLIVPADAVCSGNSRS